MSEKIASALLIVVLLGVGALAWTTELRPAFHGDPSVLGSLPLHPTGFIGEDLPMESSVENMLRADFNVQRAYTHKFGELIWLYVGYYGTERGGTPEHTPRVCYGANGWDVVEDRTLPHPVAGRGDAREFVVEQRGHQRLVLFWYRSYQGETLASTAALYFDHFVGRLREGRADGALVRLSTPLPDGDVEAARRRLQSFARWLEPELEARWPVETAVQSSS